MTKPQTNLKQPENGYVDPSDPGKGLAIAGLVMGLVFSAIGLILSIVARSKSLRAGYHNQLAVIGIWVNAVLTVLGALFTVVLIVFMLFVFKAARVDTEVVEDMKAQQTALESYYAVNGYYPGSMYELDSLSPESLVPPKGQPAYRYLPEPAGCMQCSSYRIEGTASFEVLGKRSLQPATDTLEAQ